MAITQPLPIDVDLSRLAKTLAKWQVRWTEEWHEKDPEDSKHPSLAPLARVILEQHLRNFNLWHEEDKARAPKVSDELIANVKRRIDKLNQQRNDLIEQLDDYVFRMLVQRKVETAEDATWNTETPGACIDKLSIMSLKVFHMREQEVREDVDEAHLKKCATRRKVLEQQRDDLAVAMQDLLNELLAGRKQLKLYRQFKMYNDPDLNPEIYNQK